nr:S41 family peptidase [Pseudoalteromonas luteoviolacea]
MVADLRSYPDDSRAWMQFLDAIHDGVSAGPVFNLRVSNHPDYEQRYVQSYDLSIRGSKKVLKMPIVVISNKYNISHNELTLAHFQNAKVPIVGEVTMGINGNVTDLYFSGGGPKMLRICFTGAEARQADGSKLIGVGVQPDIQVSPTREDIRNNVDAIKRAARQYVESLIQQYNP